MAFNISKIITIFGEFTDLNTYINAERTNRFKAAKIKKDNTKLCAWQTVGLPPITTNYNKIIFYWYVSNTRKDPDNIAFAKKYILDGLVDAKVLRNDRWKQISGFEDKFYVDKVKPRVEVEFINNNMEVTR
jgi:hypothetical protein